MGLFSGIRRLSESLETLAAVLQEQGPALDRLDALELSRHQFEAECHALVLKADSTLKAAANAESRERHLKNRNQQLVDSFDILSETETPARRPVLVDDVEAGQAEEVPAVHVGVAPTPKQIALNAKWGR